MTKQHLDRLQAWRLKIIQHAQSTGNVAKTCRHFGISRMAYYNWLKRYQQEGTAGLRDKPLGPHRYPCQTPQEISDRILHLRRHYHMGPWRIRMYLERYHDLVIADATVYRILKRHGLSRLPQNQAFKPQHQKWRRYEKPLLGHGLQIDTKFLDPLPGKRKGYFQFTTIDDCTRLRVLKIYERNNQKNACDFVDYVLSRLPFRVRAIQTENGPEFGAQFHWHVQDQGIGHVYIKP
jgi:transposase